MSNSLSTLEKRIRQRTEELGLNMVDLAERMGSSHSQLSRYLNGHTAPRIDTLDRIADALGVTPAWLISEAEVTHPPEECLRRVGDAVKKTLPRKEN